MPINFTCLFRDSLNFVRNQFSFFWQFSLFFALETLAFNYIVLQYFPQNLLLSPNQMDLNRIQMPRFLIACFVIHLFVSMVLYALTILGIQQISQQHRIHWQSLLIRLVNRLGGFILLLFIILAPLLLSVANLLTEVFTRSVSSPLSLVGLIFGLIIFTRLNLCFIDYLTQHRSIIQCIQYTHKQGIRRNTTLVVFALLMYLFFPILSSNMMRMASINGLFNLLFTTLSCAIYVFSLIFSFRFYTYFMPHQIQETK